MEINLKSQELREVLYHFRMEKKKIVKGSGYGRR